MIRYTQGNLLESEAQALVNTVNTEGVMGKGLALQFKTAFPQNYKIYRNACKAGRFTVGQMLITKEQDIFGNSKIIINFPTKTTWRKPSEYTYIHQGLVALRNEIITRNIQSIAIPPLGSRNGGLDWGRVRQMIETHLSDLDCDIVLYQPSEQILDRLEAEKVKLTPARAMLLDVLCDLIDNGEFASEFASEKIVYFLQRFNAEHIFRLQYSKAPYGPYSGKVRYVLRYLNGSYVMGLCELQQKPFDQLVILPGTAQIVKDYLSTDENREYKEIADKVKDFLSSYYSNFSLELLSTMDYLLCHDPLLADWHTKSQDEIVKVIMNDIASWSGRKERMFSIPKCIHTTLIHLKEAYVSGLLRYS